MSIMVARDAARLPGVLIRNAEALEMLREDDTLVVDKTGTLTEGKPKLTTVAPVAAGLSEADCWAWRRASSKLSEHPLADAIVAGAKERGVEMAKSGRF